MYPRQLIRDITQFKNSCPDDSFSKEVAENLLGILCKNEDFDIRQFTQNNEANFQLMDPDNFAALRNLCIRAANSPRTPIEQKAFSSSITRHSFLVQESNKQKAVEQYDLTILSERLENDLSVIAKTDAVEVSIYPAGNNFKLVFQSRDSISIEQHFDVIKDILKKFGQETQPILMSEKGGGIKRNLPPTASWFEVTVNEKEFEKMLESMNRNNRLHKP